MNPEQGFPQPLPPPPTAARIIETVRSYYLSHRKVLDSYRLIDWGGDHPVLNSLSRQRPTTPQVRERLHRVATDTIPLSFWYEQRQVYAPDPDLTASLIQSASSSPLPGQVLRRLPHPNPLIVFTGGLPVTHQDGAPGRLLACHIAGGISDTYDGTAHPGAPRGATLTHTTDPDINAFQLTMIAEVHNADSTQLIDLDYSRITLPLVESFTIDSLTEDVINGGYNTDPLSRPTSPQALHTYLRTALSTVLPHLLYVVSDKLEIDRSANDRPPARGKNTKGAPKPARVHYCGQRTGAAMRAWAYRRAEAERASSTTGRTVAPHWRGAHFHSYWVGPGRTEQIIKFLLPFPVNAHDDDGTTITVRPVR